MRDQGIMVRPCPECGYAYGKDEHCDHVTCKFLVKLFLTFAAVLIDLLR